MRNRFIDERYKNDPMFSRVVDMLYSSINEESGLTPIDIRDAAFLARLKYEEMRPMPIQFSPDMVTRLNRIIK